METPPSVFNPRFLVLLALQFVFGLSFSSFFLLPKYLTEVHGGSADIIGLVMAAAPVAAVAAVPLLATRIDRLPLRWLMVAGALAMAVTSLGFAPLGPPNGSMLALRALQGAGFVVFFASSTMIASLLTPPERLGQAVGLLGAANLATNALAPSVAEIVASRYGWQPVFLASALASLLATLGAFMMPTPARAAAPAPDERSVPAPIWSPRFLRLVYAGVMVGVSFGTVVTFYQPLALELGIRDVRDLFVGYTVSALTVRIVAGPWLDRFDRRRVATVACSLYALVVLATAGLQPGWLLPLGLGLGLAHGALWPVLTALSVEGSDARVRGAMITWFGGSFHLGVTISTLGFGFLAHALGYRAVLVLAAIGAASAAWLLRRDRAPAVQIA
jgi:MFS family permease